MALSKDNNYDHFLEGVNMTPEQKQDCERIVKGIITNFIDRAFGMDSVQYAVESAIINSNKK